MTAMLAPKTALDNQVAPGAHESGVVEGISVSQVDQCALEPQSSCVDLADPVLALFADALDDLERTRIANENRLRQLTRSVEDSDGETRGLGLTEDNPVVGKLVEIVEAMAAIEHKTVLALQKQLRQHPLHPWLKAQNGIGEKQGARLLASIGDPYFNDLHGRPRTVSELWAYCGLHVLFVGHGLSDPQGSSADGDKQGGSDADHPGSDDQKHRIGVAPSRKRGVKSNWSGTAKMRVFLVAESCIKKSASPYRPVYDLGRAKYADAVHQVECKRCGPRGKPALVGSELSKGHQHARAMRLVMKAILRDLWVEARTLHLAVEN